MVVRINIYRFLENYFYVALLIIQFCHVASEICVRYKDFNGNYWMQVGSKIYELQYNFGVNAIIVEGSCIDDIITYEGHTYTKLTVATYNKICEPSYPHFPTTDSFEILQNVKFQDVSSCLLYILSNSDTVDPENIDLFLYWIDGQCWYISNISEQDVTRPRNAQTCKPNYVAVYQSVTSLSQHDQFLANNFDKCLIKASRMMSYNFIYYDEPKRTCYALNLDESQIHISSGDSSYRYRLYYLFPYRLDNECGMFSCSPGNCVLTLEGAKCECDDGYEYMEAEKTCQDICLPCMGGNCEKDLEYEEGYRCMTCPDGYEVSDDGLRCEDVDECSQDTIVCHHCVNNVGSYNCSCNAGYVFNEDLKSCINVNECETQDICVNATCEDTPGSYTCNCNDGFKQVEGISNHCEDIDECSNDPFICEQECTNLVGSFKCSCNDGYALAPNGRNCTDIDECLRDPSPCQQQCNNLDGSFSCSCHTGYAFDKDKMTCIETTKPSDVNVSTESIQNTQSIQEPELTQNQYVSLERETSDIRKSTACDGDSSPCAHICKEMNDSFVCSCKEGYALASDGSSCEESGISAGATVGFIAGCLTILGSVVGIMAVYSKKANQALVFDENSFKI